MASDNAYISATPPREGNGISLQGLCVFCFVFLSSNEHIKPTVGWHFQGTHPQALALSACCSQPYPTGCSASWTCDQAPSLLLRGKGRAPPSPVAPVLPQDGVGHRKRDRTIQGEGLAPSLALSLFFPLMHWNAKALGPNGWRVPLFGGHLRRSLLIMLLQSSLHRPPAGSSVAAHHGALRSRCTL